MSAPVAFILAATDDGLMIVNRLDYHHGAHGTFGVGASLLDHGRFEPGEIDALVGILQLRRHHHGDGVVALDVGANIGTHTLAMAKAMTGWGYVVAFEAQERVYYALAGTIALNNLWNASAIHAVVGDSDGTLVIPVLDHAKPASFGSLEMLTNSREDIGQKPAAWETTRMVALDGMAHNRVDFIKLDIEGMELEALAGAVALIAHWRPVLFVERIKVDEGRLRRWLETRGYNVWPVAMSFLAVHRDDPMLGDVVVKEQKNSPSGDEPAGAVA